MTARRGATLKSVAEAAGVSVGAASFVLSGRSGGAPSGSEEVRARVLEAAEQLGYAPNRHAQAIRTGRSEIISLELDLSDPWSMPMVEAVHIAAAQHELLPIVLPTTQWYDYLVGYGSAGALITNPHNCEPDKLRRLAGQGIGVVAYSAELDPAGFDVIDTSPFPAVGHAYRQLRARHSSVALFSYVQPGQTSYYNRADAFMATVHEAGDQPDFVHCPGTPHDAYLAACTWLEGPQRPTAVIGGTAYLALAVQAAAIRLGIHVPDDLEILSLGDVPRDAHMLGQVSYWGVRDVFTRTADILVNRALQGPDSPGSKHTFTWEFFPGETTRNTHA